VLEQRFPETVASQPELLAHHYIEAGLIAQAIPYWQQAGQHAVQRFANAEAVNHLTRGLEVLKTLPDTTERTQQEAKFWEFRAATSLARLWQQQGKKDGTRLVLADIYQRLPRLLTTTRF